MANPEDSSQLPFYLRQPLRIHGCLQIALALCLLAIIADTIDHVRLLIEAYLPGKSLSQIENLFKAATKDLGLSLRIGGTVLVGAVALVTAITQLLAGISRASKPPTRLAATGTFAEPLELVRTLRDGHFSAKESNAALTGTAQLVRRYLTERIADVPHSYRRMVLRYFNSLPISLAFLGLALLIARRVIPLGQLGEIGPVHLETGFPWLLITILGLIILFRTAAAALLIPKDAPVVEAKSFRQELTASGHPRTVMEEIKGAMARLGGKEIPSHALMEEEVTLKEEPMNGIGKASGMLLLESTPKPKAADDKRLSFLGLCHSCVGAVALLAGLWYLMELRQIHLEPNAAGSINLAHPLLITVTGLLLLWNGYQLLDNATLLLGRSLYQSVLYFVDLKGTFYRGEVGVGMGQHDSLRSSTVAIRGELFIDYAIATCRSESFDDTHRQLLSLTADTRAEQHLETLRRIVAANEERGADVLGMNILASQQVKSIAQANTALIQARTPLQQIEEASPLSYFYDAEPAPASEVPASSAIPQIEPTSARPPSSPPNYPASALNPFRQQPNQDTRRFAQSFPTQTSPPQPSGRLETGTHGFPELPASTNPFSEPAPVPPRSFPPNSPPLPSPQDRFRANPEPPALPNIPSSRPPSVEPSAFPPSFQQAREHFPEQPSPPPTQTPPESTPAAHELPLSLRALFTQEPPAQQQPSSIACPTCFQVIDTNVGHCSNCRQQQA